MPIAIHIGDAVQQLKDFPYLNTNSPDPKRIVESSQELNREELRRWDCSFQF